MSDDELKVNYEIVKEFLRGFANDPEMTKVIPDYFTNNIMILTSEGWHEV